MNSLDHPIIDAAEAAQEQTVNAADAPTSRSELAKVSLREVALARFGNWRPSATALVAKYKDVAFDLSTPKGYKVLTEAIAEVRAPRYQAQNVSEKSKSELAATSKAIGAELAEIKAFLEPTETNLVAQKDAHDAKVKAAAEAEAARKATQAARVAKIRSYVSLAQGLPSQSIADGIRVLEGMSFGADWDEFTEAAALARVETIDALQKLLAITQAAEAKALQDAADREELERLRRIQADNEAKQKRLQLIGATVDECIGESAAFIEARISMVQATAVSDDAEIRDAHEGALTRLRKLHAAAKAQEAAAVELAAIKAASAPAPQAAAEPVQPHAALPTDDLATPPAPEPLQAPAEPDQELPAAPVDLLSSEAAAAPPAPLAFEDMSLETSEADAIAIPIPVLASPAARDVPAASDETAALLRDALALLDVIAPLFSGRFPNHPKPPPEWWSGVRTRVAALRPRLQAVTAGTDS